MPATLTTMDLFAKNKYMPGLESWLNRSHPLSDRIEKEVSDYAFRGRKIIFAAINSGKQSIGWLPEDGTMPVADNVGIVNMEATCKYYYGSGRISAQAMKFLTGEGAFGDMRTLEMDETRDSIRDDLAIAMEFGDGYGGIAEVASYSAATNVLTLRSPATTPGAPGTRFLRQNMYLQFYSDSVGTTLRALNTLVPKVASVDSQTQVTLNDSDPTGIAAGDWAFRHVPASDTAFGTASPGLSMMGLRGIVDDGTRVATFQSLSRSTYTLLKANILGNSGTLRPITEDLVDQAIIEGYVNGGGQYPTACYSAFEVQRRYAALLRQDRTYDVQRLDSVKYGGGFGGIRLDYPGSDGKPLLWFATRYCAPNEVVFLHEPHLFIAVGEPLGFVEDDGRIFRYTERKDSVEFWMRSWRQLCSRACNSHTALKDISHTA